MSSSTLGVYVFGNGDIYADYFNAIVRSFGTSNYSTLLRVSILLGGFSVLSSFVFKRNIFDLVKWFGVMYLCIYICFTPKTNVEIIDEVVGGKPYFVANVPLGLALLAHITTSISYQLTRLTEMNFTGTEDLRYHKTGMVFASEMIRAVSQFEITDSRFDSNIQGFINQCVFYDILLKKYSINDLLESKNIWEMVSTQASPARGFVYTDEDNYSEFKICKDTVPLLTNDWKKAMEKAQSLYASRLFPHADNPNSALMKYINVSYSYLTHLSGQADQIMKQSLMANALQRGILRMDASVNATAALESFAFVRANEQKRLTNHTVGEMASVWLPLIKNAIELFTYGSFIFVILLAILPFGLTTLKTYVYTLIWVQLWPPLYAVLNLCVSSYGQGKSLAATSAGLSLKAMPGLLQINADMAGLAGYLSMSVPVLAGGLIWGMHHAFLQSSQYAGGVAQSTAATGAAEAATGNMGFGNTNFNNHSANNTNANHFDTSARISSGAVTTQLSDGSTVTTMPNGDQVLNMGNTISNLGASVGVSKTSRAGYSQSADKATTAAENSNHAYHEADSAGMRNLYDIASHLGNGSSSGDGWTITTSGGTARAFADIQKTTQDYAIRHGISYNEAANVLSSVNADLKAGINGHVGLSSGEKGMRPSGGINLSGSGSIGGSRSAGHNNSTDKNAQFSDAAAFIKDTHYSDNVDIIKRAAHDQNLRINNEKGNRLVENMGGSFDHAEGYRKDTQSSLQEAESFRLQASKAEEKAFRIDIIAQNELANFIADQPDRDGKGKLGIESVPTIMKDPKLRDSYLALFYEQYQKKIETNWNQGLPDSKQAIEKIHNENNKKIPDFSKIQHTNELNHRAVEEKARELGLTKNNFIDYSIKTQAEERIKNASDAVEKKQQSIQHDGKAIEQKVENEKQRKRHGGLLTDLRNNIDTNRT